MLGVVPEYLGEELVKAALIKRCRTRWVGNTLPPAEARCAGAPPAWRRIMRSGKQGKLEEESKVSFLTKRSH